MRRTVLREEGVVGMSLLDRERTVAPRGYNRWLIPPAALAGHLSIGEIYAFSVFKVPLKDHFGTGLTPIGIIFSIAIGMLGLSAAFGGRWVERAGPRKAMSLAAVCWGSGFLIGAVGVATKQLWLVYLGVGFIGGIGLGIGYISPVSTLIKWFPDRPGMATGLAIMGFGGGAMIGAPLAVFLMNLYKTPTSVGVVPTFVTMGLIYFVYMMFGVFTVRVPAEGWRPVGFVPHAKPRSLVTTANVEAGAAIRTPQFWLLWVMLCVNVTAGIGILEHASPMIQEMFRGAVRPAAAAGFVSLLSLANMSGRIIWSSTSDFIGRKATYFTFFLLGAALYSSIPAIRSTLSVPLFVLATVVILSMYGGGFATIPAYLRDLFGTMQVGAIHGRLLTAWSVAGVLGPVLVNNIREFQINHGIPKAEAYTVTMYIMAGVLLLGLIANLRMSAVHRKY